MYAQFVSADWATNVGILNTLPETFIIECMTIANEISIPETIMPFVGIYVWFQKSEKNVSPWILGSKRRSPYDGDEWSQKSLAEWLQRLRLEDVDSQ